MKKSLIIYGLGKFAEYAAYVFDKDSDYNVEAFCIEEEFFDEKNQMEKPLIKFENIESTYPPKNHQVYIAVGNNEIRKRLFFELRSKKYNLATYISSKSRYWENLEVGENVFIDEGCSFQPFVKINDNAILFTTDLGHHTEIGAHSLLSGSKTGGNVKIGSNCYIGLNASIKQNIRIADNTVVGMGCVIERDTMLNDVYSNKSTIKRKINSLQLGNRFLK